jgi:hypothetical protein
MGGKRILLRGHYNPTSTSRKYPNLQYAKVGGKRLLICTHCLRNIAKVARKRVAVAAPAALTTAAK